MDLNKEVDVCEFSIYELFNQDIHFRVPIYQRNYAWGVNEIYQLLQDVNSNNQDKYYLGTIVCYRNGDKLDVIDGQQRITTLYLLLLWLKKDSDFSISTNDERKLIFESRPKTESFFDAINEKNDSKEVLEYCADLEGLDNFQTAIKAIGDFLRQEIGESERKDFLSKFLTKTKVFITVLPSSTDVNHYFEIMNIRGEQLEKHEILKAKLLEDLDSIYDKKKFAKIWDACSQMDDHIQLFFNKTTREQLFGQEYDDFPNSTVIENFLKNETDHPKEENKNLSNTAFEIISNYNLPNGFEQNPVNKARIGRFKSIIDFENFLLHVLSFTLTDENVNLEDKNLLKNFGYPEIKVSPLSFIICLIQTRYLFDKYVIKRETDEDDEENWSWSLKSFKKYESTYDRNKTFKNDSKKLEMIQSMFQVSFPTNVNKQWLRHLLKFLSSSEENRTVNSIYIHLFKQMNENYRNNQVFDGLRTYRPIFNYIDFLLWLEYYQELDEKNINIEGPIYIKKIKALRQNFKDFKFVQKNSVEHLYPQAEANDIPRQNNSVLELDYIINSIGNLCLISSSSNSSYNHYYPAQKRNKASGKNESLKQQIMFEMIENEKWGEEQILKHENEMMHLLQKHLN